MRTRANRCLVSRTGTYTRDSGLPQIRDIVGRHVLGNWLSDRMARSRLAASCERNITGRSRADMTDRAVRRRYDIIATRCRRARNTAQITCAAERDNRRPQQITGPKLQRPVRCEKRAANFWH